MRTRLAAQAPCFVLLLVALAACGRASEPSAPRGATRPQPPAPTEVRPPALPPEVLPPAREVSFTTSDGVVISGTLQPTVRTDEPLVILVHQLSSTRAEWAPLIERLHARPAIATLAVDMRGHGDSTRGPDGRTLAWREFTQEDWASTTLDVIAAAEFARHDPAVMPSSIAVIGSSIGSSAAIAAAARDTAINAVVAISPGRAYHGFDAITPALALAGRPFLAIVAQNETDSVEAASAMARITSSEAVVVPGALHGVALLEDAAQMDLVEEFVRRTLERPRDGG